MTLTERSTARKVLCGQLNEKVLDFFACSFTGWLYEVLLTLAVDGIFADRGLLRLPICPIYGIFGIFLTLLAGQPAKRIFLFVTLGATVFELAASYAIEAVLGYRLWDYSRWALNFEGRVSLLSSLVFGGLGVLFLCFISPALGRICRKHPGGTRACTAMLSVITAVDLLRLWAAL